MKQKSRERFVCTLQKRTRKYDLSRLMYRRGLLLSISRCTGSIKFANDYGLVHISVFHEPINVIHMLFSYNASNLPIGFSLFIFWKLCGCHGRHSRTRFEAVKVMGACRTARQRCSIVKRFCSQLARVDLLAHQWSKKIVVCVASSILRLKLDDDHDVVAYSR